MKTKAKKTILLHHWPAHLARQNRNASIPEIASRDWSLDSYPVHTLLKSRPLCWNPSDGTLEELENSFDFHNKLGELSSNTYTQYTCQCARRVSLRVQFVENFIKNSRESRMYISRNSRYIHADIVKVRGLGARIHFVCVCVCRCVNNFQEVCCWRHQRKENKKKTLLQ